MTWIKARDCQTSYSQTPRVSQGLHTILWSVRKGCLAKLAKDIELDAVGRQSRFEPYLSVGCQCVCTMAATLCCGLGCCFRVRTVVVIKASENTRLYGNLPGSTCHGNRLPRHVFSPPHLRLPPTCHHVMVVMARGPGCLSRLGRRGFESLQITFLWSKPVRCASVGKAWRKAPSRCSLSTLIRCHGSLFLRGVTRPLLSRLSDRERPPPTDLDHGQVTLCRLLPIGGTQAGAVSSAGKSQASLRPSDCQSRSSCPHCQQAHTDSSLRPLQLGSIYWNGAKHRVPIYILPGGAGFLSDSERYSARDPECIC